MIREQVLDATQRLSGVDEPIQDSDRLIEDLGLDSLSLVEIIVEMESTFSFVFPEEVLRSGALQTVGDLVHVVSERAGSGV